MIEPNEQVSQATCFGCSIRVRGHVATDATTFGGSVIVEEGGQVDTDATVFGAAFDWLRTARSVAASPCSVAIWTAIEPPQLAVMWRFSPEGFGSF